MAISWLLFAACAATLAVMAYVYIQDRREDEPSLPPPPSEPGHNVAVNVRDALRDEDLDVEFLRGTARTTELTQAGQGFSVDGVPLYAFIYTDVASREAESEGLEPSDVLLVTTSGTPVAGGEPHVVAGSNVIVVVLGGSEEIVEKVDRAIEGLP